MNATGVPKTLEFPPRSGTKSKSCLFSLASVHDNFFPLRVSLTPFLSKNKLFFLANFAR